MTKRLIALMFALFIILSSSAPCFAEEIVVSESVTVEETVVSESSSRLPKPKLPVEGTEITKEENDEDSFSAKFSSTVETLKKNFYNTFIRESRWKLFVDGFKNTIFIALCSTLLGILIGMVVALLKVFNAQADKPGPIIKFLNWFCGIYTTIIRGTPAVVQLFIAYYIIFKSTDNYILVSIFAFGINSGAYVSEVIRAGILAVDRGQLEAGRSLGLSHVQTMVSIILPQAFKNILPALGNEFILLLKDTSIAGYIGTGELMKAGNIVRSRTFEPYFSLISVALVYLVCVIGLEQVLNAVERRLAKSDRN